MQLIVVCLLALACLINGQSNPVPGWSFMFAGYDIRNASSMSLVDGIKYQIFEPTYNMHQTFQRQNSPVIFQVPDQISAFPITETNVLTSTSIFESADEMLREETYTYTFHFGFNIGIFGISADYTRTSGYIHYVFSLQDQYAAKGHFDSQTARFELGPYPLFKLNTFFDTLLNQKIPQCPKSATDLQNVELLVQFFGHVFPTELVMGGSFDCVTSLDANLVKQYDKTWVYSQLSLRFTYDGFDLYAGGFHNRTDIHIDSQFSKFTKTSMFFEGGERSFQSNNTEKQWYATIADQPGLISASLSSLSLLATDPVKQKNLEFIISNHANTGKIQAAPCAFDHIFPGGVVLSEIPGTPFLGAGYDSFTMTTKGFIIQHTFSDQTWTNPFYSNYTYAVPDTIHVWDNTDSVEENFTSVDLSSTQFQETLRSHVHGSGFLGFGSHSSDMYVYKSYVEYRDDVQSTNMRSINWYDLELSPLIQIQYLNYLTPWAKAVFSNLGSNISDPLVKRQYWAALDIFGDSLVTRVGMGGRLNYKGFLNNDTVQSITVEQFQQSSGWSFFGIFGSKSSYKYYQKYASDAVKTDMVAEIKAEGGNWEPVNPAFKKTTTGAYSFALKDIDDNVLDFDDFVKSIKDNLVPVRYEIIPMYQIFDDAVIRDNFMQVTQEYLKSKMMRRRM